MNTIFRAEAFYPDDQLRCLGTQVARLLTELHSLDCELIWYVAHVLPYLEGLTSDQPSFVCFGDTGRLIQAVKKVDQFLQGVFAAVPKSVSDPQLRELAYTDDEFSAPLGDSIVEIRAFDTSYFDIIIQDKSFASRFRKRSSARFIEPKQE